MIITKDSEEICLDGNQYLYIGIDNDDDEECVDLICDGLVEILLDKPLLVTGNIRAGRLHGGIIYCRNDVDVTGDVNMKKLVVDGACVSVGSNLIANHVSCDDLTVNGNAYVEDHIYCYGSVYIRGDLRSHIPNTLKVTACGGLHVDKDVDVDSVAADFVDVNGYLKTYGDIKFRERIKVKNGISCGGEICYEEDIDDC